MADVNVEFGATDTGLEATLKTVQEQMTRLEAEVKSGTLSFDELSQKMRQLAQAEKIDQKLRDIGTASAEARPNVDALGNTVLDAGQKSDQSAGLFDSSFQKISAAFTVGNLAAMGFEKAIDLAFGAARAVVDAFGQALDLGGRLNDLSARTGETAGKLLILEQAFRDSGLSADQVGVAINKLQNFMAEAQAGGEAQAQAMQRLGISMDDLAGKTPTQQMEVFAQAISKIKDPTQRAAIAGDVFGDKLGGRLLPLLTQFSPALDDAGTKVGSFAGVMDKNAATFDKVGESIDAAKGKLTAFAAGILDKTIPAVESLGTAMEGVDAAGLGQKIGATIAPALQKLTDATNGALSALKQLSEVNSKAATDTGLLGETYRNVTASLNGFNQMMHNAFTQFTPFGAGMELLRLRGEELRNSQTQAGAAIEQTGNKATEAAPKIERLSQGANDLPAAFQSTLPLVGEFNAQLDQSFPSMEGVKAQSGLIKDDFSEIVVLSAQLPGKFDAQTQSIGGVTAQLELQKELYGLITPKVEEVREDIVKTEESAGGATEKIKEFKSFVDLIAASKPDDKIESLREKSAKAREEIEAFGEYIGKDLSRMSMPDIAKELGVDTLGQDGSEQIDTILNHIKAQMPDAKINPVDEDAGKASADEIADEIDTKLGKQQYSVDVKPEVDQAQLDAQIADMQAQITNQFTGGEGGPGGAGGAGGNAEAGDGGEGGAGGDATADITSLVDFLRPWQQVIEAIRDSLPLRALA